MKMNKLFTIITIALLAKLGIAQDNSLTGSPYSLYGLGLFSETNLGKTNALGRSGIALQSEIELNNLNPAALATIQNKSFLFDVGMTAELDSYENQNSNDKKWRYSFSNIAIAFPVSKKAAMSIVLTPFTNVGYELIGQQNNIEGSNNNYATYVTGNGGLNSIKVSYGFKTGKFNIGAGIEYIFGKIEEKETVTTNNAYLLVNRDTYYKNPRAIGGIQYNLNPDFTLAATVKSPTSLSASQNLEVSKYLELTEVTVEDTEEVAIDNFSLPLEFSIGFKKTFAKNFTINSDYTRAQWSATNEKDNIGTYKDMDRFGLGFEYFNKQRSNNYFKRIIYRAGFTTDNGYLSVRNTNIDNTGFTFGLGLPLSQSNNSFLNIAYQYGQRGAVSATLIKENYHLISLNLSLENMWFVKRKYN